MTADWDPDEYDQQIIRERNKDKKLARVSPNGGSDRGEASPAELKRRREADQAIAALLVKESREQAPKPPTPPDLSAKRKAARALRAATVRWPQPKQKASGRWRAACTHNGTYYSKTFDTKAEAERYIKQVKEG